MWQLPNSKRLWYDWWCTKIRVIWRRVKKCVFSSDGSGRVTLTIDSVADILNYKNQNRDLASDWPDSCNISGISLVFVSVTLRSGHTQDLWGNNVFKKKSNGSVDMTCMLRLPGKLGWKNAINTKIMTDWLIVLKMHFLNKSLDKWS